MIVWAVRVLAVVVVALAIACGVQTWRLGRAHDRDIETRAAIQAEQLVAAGWQEAYKASEAELARKVPALERELDAVRKAKATLAGTSHWTGSGAAVSVPCIVTVRPSAGTTTPAPHPAHLGESEAPLAVAVTPHVKIDDAISLDDAGGVYVARKVHARLSVGETWASEWQPVTADAESTTAVDPRIGEAWKAYRNPPPRIAFVRSPRLWRAGLSCGAGVGYGFKGSDLLAACVWGIQF